MSNRLWLLFCLFILSTHSVQVNLILNGDFSYNLCPESFCSWNADTYLQTDVYGWLPNPQISIAAGKMFNQILGNQKVLPLSQNQNSCVKQVFGSLTPGSYKLSLEYTSYQNQQKSQNTPFNVYFNGELLKTITSQSNQLKNQSIEIKLDSFSTNVELKFCGAKTSENENYGAILTKVELWGEGKGYLRKQNLILETYHSLPLRERTTRLLQTSVIPSLPTSGSQTTKNLLPNLSTVTVTPIVIDSSVSKNSGSESTSSSVPSVSSWNEKPAPSTLKFDIFVEPIWKSKQTCTQAQIFRSSWSEKPFFISTDQIIKNGWNSNSNANCKSQIETKGSSIAQKSPWIETKKVFNLDDNGLKTNQWKSNSNYEKPTDSPTKQSQLWSSTPSNIILQSNANSGWNSNSNFDNPSNNKILVTDQQKQNLKPLNLIETESKGENPLVSLIGVPKVQVSPNPSISFVKIQKQGLAPNTKLTNGDWKSDVNDTEKTDSSTNSLWEQKQSKVSNNQPLDPNTAWKSNSKFIEQPNTQKTIEQKPTTETQPKLTLQDLIHLSVKQNTQVTSEPTKLNTQKPTTETQTKITFEELKPSIIPSNLQVMQEPPKVNNEKPTIKILPQLTLEELMPPSLPINLNDITESPTANNQKPATEIQPIIPTNPPVIAEPLIVSNQKLTTESQPTIPSNPQVIAEPLIVSNQKPTNEIQPTIPTNAQVIAEPLIVSNQKPTTESQPSIPTNAQVIAEPPKVSVSKPIDSHDLPTDVKLLNFANSSPDFLTQNSVLSNIGSTQQNKIIHETNDLHLYHSESASMGPMNLSPPILTKMPTVENHIIEQIIVKPSTSSQNLISNGDFQTYKCAFLPCLINEMIPGSSLSSWIPEPFIQIGKINQYNPSLKTGADNIGAHLGFSTKNTCIKQSLKTLTTNYYELSFDYAPVVPQSSDFVSEAFFIVKFNGKNVKNILCLDNLSHRQSMVVKGIKGENIIEFCAFGSSNENPHGAIIDNVSLTLKPNLENLKTDFILNGDFENNQCYSKSCLWGQGNFNSKYLPGWVPEPEIQIGKGNLYNVHAGISTVAELSSNSNSCIKQIIDNCVRGSFKLTFSWAARQSEALHDSVFQVKVNNQLVQSYIPDDYGLHRENLVLSLNEGRNELKFCSFGMNNDKGAIIDDVSMFLIDTCSNRI